VAALLFSVLSFILSLVFVPNAGLKINTFKSTEQPPKHYDNVIDVEGKVVDQDKKADIRDIGT
jgi:hypothetical protein